MSIAAGVEPPLVVDMDGTLLRTDSLAESLFVLARRHPILFLSLPFQLVHGRAAFARAVAINAQPDIDTLPFNEPLLEFLRAEKRRGRQLVLATGADEHLARRVADHVGLFDRVFASDGIHNLNGAAKRESLVAAFGAGGFDYAGNSARDLLVWPAARRAIVVGEGVHRLAAVRRIASVDHVFADDPQLVARRRTTWLQELRWHHWVKNGLVLMPWLFAHGLREPAALGNALLATIAFCAVASSIYLLNDLLDLPSDRRHPHKRQRPIASGRLPILEAIAVVPLLWAVALVACVALPAGCGVILAVYVAAMIAYSLRLKDYRYVDAAVLGGGYTLRLLLGGAAIAQGFDPWLPAWSLPTFLGLALLKRRAELASALAHAGRAGVPVHARAYGAADIPLLETVGHVSALVGMVVLATLPLVLRGSLPAIAGLWAVCSALTAWTLRMWRCAADGRIAGDPVTFALHDRGSRWLGAVAFLGLLAVA
jgi:4-hydroxybenzoate polyprenyltransferase